MGMQTVQDKAQPVRLARSRRQSACPPFLSQLSLSASQSSHRALSLPPQMPFLQPATLPAQQCLRGQREKAGVFESCKGAGERKAAGTRQAKRSSEAEGQQRSNTRAEHMVFRGAGEEACGAEGKSRHAEGAASSEGSLKPVFRPSATHKEYSRPACSHARRQRYPKRRPVAAKEGIPAAVAVYANSGGGAEERTAMERHVAQKVRSRETQKRGVAA